MNPTHRRMVITACAATLAVAALGVEAQDWPQWRGANRDARAVGFQAPKTWPKELTQKWKVTVGEGVSTPALVGDRIYVFSRQEGNEVIRCLAVSDGKELWQDKYESLGASGPAQGFSGPRSSPAVAEGKVVTLGVRGMVSSLDAKTGKPLWRKDEFQAYPNFHPSSSPLIVDGVAVVQVGGRENGALVAYDVSSGETKWKRNSPCPSYASPALLTAGGTRYIVAQTETKLVAVKAADGSLAWESAAPPAGGGPGSGPGAPAGQGGGGRGMGGGRDYRASSPIVNGDSFVLAGRGIRAFKMVKDGDKMVEQELWNNAEKTVQFNTPLLREGFLYGLANNNELFCLDAKDGQTLWSAPWPSNAPGASASRTVRDAVALFSHQPMLNVLGQAQPSEPPRPGGPGGPGGGRRGGGMGGGAGYGSVVDVGSALLALTPSGQLIVLEPSAKEFKQLAIYRVAEGQTYAYPVASKNRILVKDKDTLTLWTVE